MELGMALFHSKIIAICFLKTSCDTSQLFMLWKLSVKDTRSVLEWRSNDSCFRTVCLMFWRVWVILNCFITLNTVKLYLPSSVRWSYRKVKQTHAVPLHVHMGTSAGQGRHLGCVFLCVVQAYKGPHWLICKQSTLQVLVQVGKQPLSCDINEQSEIR